MYSSYFFCSFFLKLHLLRYCMSWTDPLAILFAIFLFPLISQRFPQLYLLNIIFLQSWLLDLVRDTVFLKKSLFVLICFRYFLLTIPTTKIEQIIKLWYIHTGEYYIIIEWVNNSQHSYRVKTLRFNNRDLSHKFVV